MRNFSSSARRIDNGGDIATSSCDLRLTTAAVALALVAALLLFSPQASFAAQTREYTGTSFGPNGTGSGEAFERIGAVAADSGTGSVYVLDTSKGSVYKFTEAGEPADFSALQTNEITGLPFWSENDVEQIAVDQSSHDFYVVESGAGYGSIEKFDASGEPADFSSLGSPQLEAEAGSEFCGVAVDSAGDVYVGDYDQGVAVYSPAGELLTSIAAAGTCHVAVGSTGTVYANAWGGSVVRYEPSEYPPTATTSYSSPGSLAEGTNHAVYADPSGGPVLVDEGAAAVEFDVDGTFLGRFANSGEGQVSDSEAVAYGSSASAAFVGDGSSGRVKIFGAPFPQKPIVTEESVSAVWADQANLEASINPNGYETTAYLEYGFSPCSVGPCEKTAAVSLGAGEAPATARFVVEGLEPGTTYYFRVRASSSAGSSTGADRSFTTSATASQPSHDCPNEGNRTPPARWLLDCRAYEMVSPVDKEGNDIKSLPDITGYPTDLDQSSSDGEALTFSTFGAFAGSPSNPYVSQYLSTRSAGGWSTRSLMPPRETADEVFKNEFKAFTPDLSTAWVVHSGGPSLAPGGPAEGKSLYERSTASNTYRAINTIEDSEFVLEGLNPISPQGFGGGHTIFQVTTDNEEHTHVFDEHGGTLDEVSVLPDGSRFPGSASAGAYTVGLRPPWLSHAVSADGSIVYWTGYESENGNELLFARVNDQETVPVSELVTGSNPNFSVSRFRLASADGSRALFTVKEFGSSPALYEYSLASHSVQEIAGEAVGVVGGSEDMSSFYFVSLEDLAGGAEAGQPNLYMDQGGDVSLVAVLSPLDTTAEGENIRQPQAVSPYPLLHSSAVSADGTVLVFESRGAPTGYDNRGVSSGEPENEVYRFDASTAQLDCLSCNPSGSRPEGRETILGQGPQEPVWSAAQVPGWQTSLHQPKVIADGGKRVFFDAFTAILPRDVNGQEDVYEWEAPGAGDCTTESPAYVRQSGGCLDLVSTGQDTLDSEFLDASPAGRDVFFSTAQSLAGSDPGFIDVYDAREFGGFPEAPTAPSACEGQACQGGASRADSTPGAGSATFVGPHNRRHKHHKKHHKKRHKKKHHANGKHRRAGK